MDAADARGHFMARCRNRGVRVTMQRMAVYQALAEDKTHPTANSICTKLRRSTPTLSLATVYRILDSLEREGLIRRVSSPNGVLRFDANLDPHQHFICRICGIIKDFSSESLSGLRLPDDQLAGFVAEGIDIRIVGICRECRRDISAARQSSKRPVIGKRIGFNKKEEIRWPH
jgi:Fe2+ or Zn2+ uptake regulation protein